MDLFGHKKRDINILAIFINMVICRMVTFLEILENMVISHIAIIFYEKSIPMIKYITYVETNLVHPLGCDIRLLFALQFLIIV